MPCSIRPRIPSGGNVANPGPEDGIALWVVEDEALAHQDNCDLDDGCWEDAATVTFGIGEKAANRTTLRLTYDHSNLYLSARCQEGITKPPGKLGRSRMHLKLAIVPLDWVYA